MKAINKSIFVMTMMFNASLWAVNIVVKGEPVQLVPYEQIYQLPANYNATNLDYLYVTTDGINRVCYMEANPALQSLKMKIITININGKNSQWNCYETGNSTVTQ